MTKTCRWHEDDDGNWWTDCGNGFVLNPDDPPAKHGMKFCCYCGGRLTGVRYVIRTPKSCGRTWKVTERTPCSKFQHTCTGLHKHKGSCYCGNCGLWSRRRKR